MTQYQTNPTTALNSLLIWIIFTAVLSSIPLDSIGQLPESSLGSITQDAFIAFYPDQSAQNKRNSGQLPIIASGCGWSKKIEWHTCLTKSIHPDFVKGFLWIH